MKMSSLSQGGLDRLHRAMAARVSKGELPGMVTLLAQGHDVHVDAIGTMAFGSAEPMRRDTIFRIASLTKPILATATMTLVEDGTLVLDEPIDRMLPQLANRRVLRHVDGPLDDTVAANRPITVEDLLTFRMGHGMLIEPTFDPPFPIVRAANELQLVMGPPDPRTPHDPDRWIERFGTLPLMYQPGERWRYDTGSLVLGVLVARAAGQPLEAFLRTRIFEPLGMKETGFSMPAEQTGRLPSQYTTDFHTGKVELQTLTGPDVWTRPPAFPSGAGGLLSTVDDYLAFARLLLNKGLHRDERLLSERSAVTMTTNHLTPEQIAGGGLLLSGSGWGFGMAVTVTPDDVSPVPGRYGWSAGYGTTWFNDPQRQLVAIALTQTDSFLFNGGLAEFDQLVPPPFVRPGAPASPSAFDQPPECQAQSTPAALSRSPIVGAVCGGSRTCSDPNAFSNATWPNCPDKLFQFHHQPFNYFASWWRAPKISMLSSTSLRHVPTNLSAIEFARGARYGSRTTSTPSEWKT